MVGSTSFIVAGLVLGELAAGLGAGEFLQMVAWEAGCAFSTTRSKQVGSAQELEPSTLNARVGEGERVERGTAQLACVKKMLRPRP